MMVLVGEIGINHNGDMGIVKKLIDVAAGAGLDYVKFQKRTVKLVYSKEELDSLRESPWGTTFREQKEGLEFDKKEYNEIDRYCKEKGIGWFASPWDIPSLYFLVDNYDLPFVKVPSPLVTNSKFLAQVVNTRNFVVLSTGMSTIQEVTKAVNRLGSLLQYILACTSTYPTPLDEVNLRFISTLKECFPKYRVGYSSHHPGIFFPSVAAAFGAEMIEFHITLDRAMYGSDQAASLEPGQIMKLVKYVRNLEVALGNGEWTVFPGEEAIKRKLRK